MYICIWRLSLYIAVKPAMRKTSAYRVKHYGTKPARKPARQECTAGTCAGWRTAIALMEAGN